VADPKFQRDPIENAAVRIKYNDERRKLISTTASLDFKAGVRSKVLVR